MSHTRAELPDLPALTPEGVANVDAIVRAAGELWWIEPSNNRLVIMDVREGLDALRGNHEITALLAGDTALVFRREEELGGSLHCLCVHLERQSVEQIYWIALPPIGQGRLLAPREREFIDAGLREYGQFGVYGDVTDGLEALWVGMEITIRDRADHYDFNLSPRDGHGHYLGFAMDKTTGVIDGCVARHGQPAAVFEDPV